MSTHTAHVELWIHCDYEDMDVDELHDEIVNALDHLTILSNDNIELAVIDNVRNVVVEKD